MTWRVWCLGLCSLWLSGCQSMSYYGQNIKGQWQILSQRQSLQKVIKQPQTPPKLVKQLQTIQQIRQFAASLHLPTTPMLILNALMPCGRWPLRPSYH